MVGIKTISLPLPLKMGTVNCYLLEIGTGFVLIDTGSSNQRQALLQELAAAGCKTGDIKLIVITHGDFDHTGNAAYLREMYKAPIAMHGDDVGMAELGDMFWNRKSGGFFLRLFSRLVPKFFGFRTEDRFTPDIVLQQGESLSGYDLDASVILLGGHSKGSIGILTAEGDLFSGDLIDNTEEPVLNSIMDDLQTAEASLREIKNLDIHMIYPGHGQPFSIDKFNVTT